MIYIPCPGNAVQLTGTFTDQDGNPGDPSTVTVEILAPGACEPESYVYGEDGSGVTRSSVGVYSFELTPDKPGRWGWAFVGTGDHEAADKDVIVVPGPILG